MKRFLWLMILFVCLPVAAQRGGPRSPVVNLLPTCSATPPSGGCPSDMYFCMDSNDAIWRCMITGSSTGWGAADTIAEGTSFPASPGPSDLFIVTDDSAVGACDSAGGTAVSFCRYSGSAWAPVGGSGSGSGTDTGDEVTIDGVSTTDPNFVDDGDIDLVLCTSTDPGVPDASCAANQDVLFRINDSSVDTDAILDDTIGAGDIGADAVGVAELADAGTPVAGNVVVVASDLATFEYAAASSATEWTDEGTVLRPGTADTNDICVRMSGGAGDPSICGDGTDIWIEFDNDQTKDTDTDIILEAAGAINTPPTAAPSYTFTDSNEVALGHGTDTQDAAIVVNCPSTDDCDLDILLDQLGNDTAVSVLNFDTPDATITTATLQNIGVFTVTTDSTGDAEVVLPNDAVGIAEVDLAAQWAFTGGLAAPQGAAPTVDAAGEVAVDTDGYLAFYDGADRRLPAVQWLSTVLDTPADVDSYMLLKAPYAMTITDIHCIVDPGGSSESVVIDIQECTSAGVTCVTVDAPITCDNDGAEDDAALSNGTIDAGDWVNFDIGTVTGTVTQVSVTIHYTVDVQ